MVAFPRSWMLAAAVAAAGAAGAAGANELWSGGAGGPGVARRQSVSAEMGEMQRWHAGRAARAGTRHEHSRTAARLQVLRGGSSAAGSATKPGLLVRAQNGLAASRAVILWFVKGLLAAFTGLLITSAVMVAFEFTAHKVSPVEDLTAMMPDYLAALVLVGAVVGSVLGSWVLTKLSPSHPTVLALGVSSLFTAAQWMNLQVVEHPLWYKWAGIASFIPPYILTSFLGTGGLSSTSSRKNASKSLRFASPSKRTASPTRTEIKSPKTPAKTPSKSATKEAPKTPKSASGGKSSASSGKAPKSAGKSAVKTPSKTPSKPTPRASRSSK